MVPRGPRARAPVIYRRCYHAVECGRRYILDGHPVPPRPAAQTVKSHITPDTFAGDSRAIYGGAPPPAPSGGTGGPLPCGSFGWSPTCRCEARGGAGGPVRPDRPPAGLGVGLGRRRPAPARQAVGAPYPRAVYGPSKTARRIRGHPSGPVERPRFAYAQDHLRKIGVGPGHARLFSPVPPLLGHPAGAQRPVERHAPINHALHRPQRFRPPGFFLTHRRPGGLRQERLGAVTLLPEDLGCGGIRLSGHGGLGFWEVGRAPAAVPGATGKRLWYNSPPRRRVRHAWSARHAWSLPRRWTDA